MNIVRRKSFHAIIIFGALSFMSCNREKGIMPPIKNGVSVTINNTFQSIAFDLKDETPIEDLFQVPPGSLYATALVSPALEFDNYLLNLYDVDIDERSITFEMAAEAGDPTYGSLFRTIEAGTTDRYYLNFSKPHNIRGFTVDNPSVNLRIDSETTLVVEIGEGFDFNPGVKFKIKLK